MNFDAQQILAFSLGPWEITLILAVVILLFGAKRLPELAKSVGKSMKEFKKAVNTDEETPDKSESVSPKENAKSAKDDFASKN